MSRLAERLEQMAEAAFGLQPNQATRRGAEEIAGFIRQITAIPVERSEEPFWLNMRVRDDDAED